MNAWLSVEVSDGLFTNERLAKFHTAGGEEVALFVTDVATVSGKLKVRVMESNAVLALVEIPSNDGAVIEAVKWTDLVKENKND